MALKDKKNADGLENLTPEQLKAEKKQFKKDRKEQKKEVKRRAREIARQEDELIGDEEPSKFSVALVTLMIILIWLAILCVLVKLDVGGIGSGVLEPLLKNIPVINKILPEKKTISSNDEEADDPTLGYGSIEEAAEQIRRLEMELQATQEADLAARNEIEELRAEVNRLRAFEDAQSEFEKNKEDFYQQVVYAENGPGPEEYVKYFESMDPASAERLYREVIVEQSVTDGLKKYAEAYAAMKPKEAAAIFDTMTDDLELVAKILGAMGSDDRGKILGQMTEEIAARVTKIMDPENG